MEAAENRVAFRIHGSSMARWNQFVVQRTGENAGLCYLPWIVVFSHLILAIFIALLLDRDRFAQFKSLLRYRIGALAIAPIVAVVCTAIWYFALRSTVRLMLETEYPGKRSDRCRVRRVCCEQLHATMAASGFFNTGR